MLQSMGVFFNHEAAGLNCAGEAFREVKRGTRRGLVIGIASVEVSFVSVELYFVELKYLLEMTSDHNFKIDRREICVQDEKI